MRTLWKALFPVVLIAATAGAQAQTVLATFNYPLGVSGVAVDYLCNRTFVLLPNFINGSSSAVQEIDGSNNVVKTIPVPTSNAIAVNVVTGLVYVGGAIPSTTNPSGIESVVAVVNPRKGTVTSVIPVTATGGFGIVALAVDPVTDRIFVSNASDDSLVVINGRTNAITASVSLNSQVPAGLGVNFITGRVYAALNNNQVAILRESTNAVTYATYGSQTSAVAVDPVLNREYVTDAVFDTPTVGVLSSKGQTLASVPVGLFPQGIDVDFVTSLVFVANEADGTITEFTAQGGSVIATIPIAANSIAVNPAQSTVYAVGPTSVTVFAE